MKKKTIIETILYVTLSMLTACTSYIWNPLTKTELNTSLDKDVGEVFYIAYPFATEKDIFNESPTYKEYVFDRYSECAWVVKVNKGSNTIESWHYLKSCNLP